MTQKRILIFGISTCAKNIYNFIKKYNLFEIIGFAIDPEYRSIDSYCGLPVFDINQIDSFFS